MFQFTHPGKGATTLFRESSRNDLSFNSRTLGRVRLRLSTFRTSFSSFNSRTLGRVRQIATYKNVWRFRVSIHAPWEGCDVARKPESTQEGVSIHAPWEGCDFVLVLSVPASAVSIHAPWEGCDK